MKKILTTLVLFLATLFILNAQKLTVASYNIRLKNSGDSIKGNGWYQRCPVICKLIEFNDFDIFGAQEVTHPQLVDMLKALPGYAYVGVGRDDGKTGGEYSPVFYKRDKFKLLKSGTFWLSTITDVPNKGWDAALPRICTWGNFEDIQSGVKFWFFNLHMDHVGVQARSESAKLVLAKIKEMVSETEFVILTGDFNVDQTNESYKLLATSSVLKDSYENAAIRYALNGTFNNFDINIKTDSRIDHIFTSHSVNILRYGILTDMYWADSLDTSEKSEPQRKVSQCRIPSDHYPVKVELSFK